MRVLWLVALVGCGRFGFGGRDTADGKPSDGPGNGQSDGPSDGSCTWSAFATPIVLPGPVQSATDDWVPTPSDAGRQIFFHTYRGSSRAEIWTGKRASTSIAFGAATKVTELVTTGQYFSPTLTDDGLRMIVADSRSGNFKLYETVRTSAAATWPTPQLLANINTGAGADDNYAFVSADGLHLYWASQRTSSLHSIVEASRPDLASNFGAVLVHDELDVTENNWLPTVSNDGLELFYSGSTGGPNSFDVFTAHRNAIGDRFSAPTKVTELSSAGDDIGLRLTPDGTTMYFNYMALTSGGDSSIYTATRTCD